MSDPISSPAKRTGALEIVLYGMLHGGVNVQVGDIGLGHIGHTPGFAAGNGGSRRWNHHETGLSRQRRAARRAHRRAGAGR